MILSINFYFFYKIFKIVTFFQKKAYLILVVPLFGIQKDDCSGFCVYYVTGRRYAILGDKDRLGP